MIGGAKQQNPRSKNKNVHLAKIFIMSRKNYLVVGGSSGIGLSLVKKLSHEGHGVMVISRRAENLRGLSNVAHLPKDILADDINDSELHKRH